MLDQYTTPSDETTSADPTHASENNEKPLFTYNVYQIRSDARSYYSERDYAQYCKMVDSILSHNGVVEGFAFEDEFWRIWYLWSSEFIPFGVMLQTYNDTNEPRVYDNGTVT